MTQQGLPDLQSSSVRIGQLFLDLVSFPARGGVRINEAVCDSIAKMLETASMLPHSVADHYGISATKADEMYRIERV